MTPEERFEKFQKWLDFMPEALADWMDGLPPDLRDKLDYSLDSLGELENWLLSEYSDPAEAVSGDNFLMGDGAARYIGETFRKRFGASWGMDVHDPNSLVFGTPSMRGFPKPGSPVAPLRLVVNLLKKRKGNYLEFIVQHLE